MIQTINRPALPTQMPWGRLAGDVRARNYVDVREPRARLPRRHPGLGTKAAHSGGDSNEDGANYARKAARSPRGTKGRAPRGKRYDGYAHRRRGARELDPLEPRGVRTHSVAG